MGTSRIVICAVSAALLALTACAVSPEAENKRQEMEADIDEIMSYELDEAVFGEPRNCLAENEYRSFRALGDRHLLFEGRNDKQWVNVLRGRCTDLLYHDVFIMKPGANGRLCDMDGFGVVDLSNPTMRQIELGAGISCMLGEFKPVASAQVREIDERLEMR